MSVEKSIHVFCQQKDIVDVEALPTIIIFAVGPSLDVAGHQQVQFLDSRHHTSGSTPGYQQLAEGSLAFSLGYYRCSFSFGLFLQFGCNSCKFVLGIFFLHALFEPSEKGAVFNEGTIGAEVQGRTIANIDGKRELQPTKKFGGIDGTPIS